MKTALLVPLPSLALLVTGCPADKGGGVGSDPLEGTYQVTSHVYSFDSCTPTSPADDVADPPYFELKMVRNFGPSLALFDCVAPGDCEGDDDFATYYLYERDDDGSWSAEAFGASFLGECEISLQVTAVVSSGGSVRVDDTYYAMTLPGVTESDCESDLVEEHRDELTCDSLETYRGVLAP